MMSLERYEWQQAVLGKAGDDADDRWRKGYLDDAAREMLDEQAAEVLDAICTDATCMEDWLRWLAEHGAEELVSDLDAESPEAVELLDERAADILEAMRKHLGLRFQDWLWWLAKHGAGRLVQRIEDECIEEETQRLYEADPYGHHIIL